MQIRNKFKNENSNENTYALLSDSSNEIDELGSLVSEYRKLDVYDYVYDDVGVGGPTG